MKQTELIGTINENDICRVLVIMEQYFCKVYGSMKEAKKYNPEAVESHDKLNELWRNMAIDQEIAIMVTPF